MNPLVPTPGEALLSLGWLGLVAGAFVALGVWLVKRRTSKPLDGGDKTRGQS